MVNGDPNGVNPWDQEAKRKAAESASSVPQGTKVTEDKEDWSDDDEDAHMADKKHQTGLAKQLGDYRADDAAKKATSDSKKADLGMNKRGNNMGEISQ
jgi:hypothetical protein